MHATVLAVLSSLNNKYTVFINSVNTLERGATSISDGILFCKIPGQFPPICLTYSFGKSYLAIFKISIDRQMVHSVEGDC